MAIKKITRLSWQYPKMWNGSLSESKEHMTMLISPPNPMSDIEWATFVIQIPHIRLSIFEILSSSNILSLNTKCSPKL